MDIEGVRLWRVLDKGGALIDIRLFFTASNGQHVALYVFDKQSSKTSQAAASVAIDKSKTLTRMKETVETVGTDAPAVVTQHVAASFDGIVPSSRSKLKQKDRTRLDTIRFGKSDSAARTFSVRLKIPQGSKDDPIVLDVPFRGEPGDLDGEVFHGEAEFLIDGSKPVAEVKLELYGVGT